MRYRVIKDADGSVRLFVDDELDLTGDEDAVDERLWELYGRPDPAPET